MAQDVVIELDCRQGLSRTIRPGFFSLLEQDTHIEKVEGEDKKNGEKFSKKVQLCTQGNFSCCLLIGLLVIQLWPSVCIRDYGRDKSNGLSPKSFQTSFTTIKH